jgi:hypothetical protein
LLNVSLGGGMLLPNCRHLRPATIGLFCPESDARLLIREAEENFHRAARTTPATMQATNSTNSINTIPMIRIFMSSRVTSI